MKKELYCINCEEEFIKEIKSMKDLKNIKCPKCNKIVNSTNKKIIPPTKTEKTIENITNTIINIYFYFYFITSTLALIFYIINQTKLFEIVTIITIIGIIIDYILGYTRNIFGTLGLIVCSIIGVLILKDTKQGIFIGITTITFISSTIKLIINKLINRLYRKYGELWQ